MCAHKYNPIQYMMWCEHLFLNIFFLFSSVLLNPIVFKTENERKKKENNTFSWHLFKVQLILTFHAMMRSQRFCISFDLGFRSVEIATALKQYISENDNQKCMSSAHVRNTWIQWTSGQWLWICCCFCCFGISFCNLAAFWKKIVIQIGRFNDLRLCKHSTGQDSTEHTTIFEQFPI